MHDPTTPAAPRPGTPWWKTAVGYQVYPVSFRDSDGDGRGDIPGIVEGLDHLADLGVGFVWLSPVYRSPMRDNGYDIADYRDVAPVFGTMSDMDRLVAEARARGIGIVMDLVVNHTSDRHAWFGAARRDPAAPEHDYYIWRAPAPDGGPPSALRASFGGSAWHWIDELGLYYLGYFSAHHPDLNWRNPALRAEIHALMNWWLDRGIAGFRMDVISLIGKDIDAGIYEEGPHLHPYLQEMHRAALAGRDVVAIGESWSVSTRTAPLYCGRDRGELDMVFQFQHVVAGWDETHGKFRPKPFDLPRLKRVLADWQAALADDGWNSLFLSNHDLPRQVSVYGDDGAHRARSARMLAVALHLMKGTPFVYQGEEIGMTNMRFASIDQFRDIETLGHHADQIAQGVPVEDFLAGANASSRDNARTPMQWTAGPGAGFTTGTPWIAVNPNHATVNVAADRADPDGVMATYRTLVRLRREMGVVVHGRFALVDPDHPEVFAYARSHEGERLRVVAHFGADPLRWTPPPDWIGPGRSVVSNVAPRDGLDAEVELAPYEAFALWDR